MSVEYYLVNKENKTFFDLGKGGWYELASDKEYLTDLDLLEEFIFDDVFNMYSRENNENNREYYKNLAKELYEFCFGANINNILIIDDCGDDSTILRALGYKCVGTRYLDSKYSSRKQRVEFENRHLDPKNNIKYTDILQDSSLFELIKVYEL